MINVNIKARDELIRWVPPENDDDARVPTAEEMHAQCILDDKKTSSARSATKPAGLLQRPTLNAFSSGSVALTTQRFEFRSFAPSPTPNPASSTLSEAGLVGFGLLNSGDLNGGTIRFWQNLTPSGNQLRYSLNVTGAGTYRANLRILRADDLGIFNITINGRAYASNPVDFYAPNSTNNLQVLNLGDFPFNDGVNEIVFTSANRNGNSDNYYLIIDYLEIIPVTQATQAPTTSDGVIIPPLSVFSQKHPFIVQTQSHSLAVPPLPDSALAVSRYDYVYLAVFSAVINQALDPDLALSFTWRKADSTLQSITKENTRRHRGLYAFVLSEGPTTIDAIWNTLPIVNEKKTLSVSKSSAGSVLGDFRIYPLDPEILDGRSYELASDSLELIDICRVWRVQNNNQQGYLWGRNGEQGLLSEYHVQPTYKYVGEGWDLWQSRLTESAQRIMSGKPLINTPGIDRSVHNLVNGQVGTNLDAPGVATASPNGSTALANGQRIIFSNKEAVQDTFCAVVVTTDSGGNAQATVNFAGNSPAGSRFSANQNDHRIYSATGNDVSGEGTFTGLDGTGALTWTANPGASIAPGATAYLVPGILYPAGSGFPSTGDLEAVYRDATPISVANIRNADLTAYQAPANNEDYFAVYEKRVSGIKLYKRLIITSSGTGIVAIPNTENGVIAFIGGPSAPAGRQNRPVIGGLSNNSNYELLIEYAPPGSEAWQFQVKGARYGGTQNQLWLNGATVRGRPIAIAHTLGGNYDGDETDLTMRDSVIGARLPRNSLTPDDAKNYAFSTKVQFQGGYDPGAAGFRSILPPDGGGGFAGLQCGQIIQAQAAAATQAFGISMRLASDNLPLGISKPPLEGNGRYQLVLFCDVEKQGEHKILAIAINGGDPSQTSFVAFDSDLPHHAAMDVFEYF